MFVMKTKCLLSPLQSTKHELLENCPNNAYTFFLHNLTILQVYFLSLSENTSSRENIVFCDFQNFFEKRQEHSEKPGSNTPNFNSFLYFCTGPAKSKYQWKFRFN